MKFLDDIKQLGFRMAFRGGLSFNINDLIIPDTKEQQLDNAKVEVDEVWDNYKKGADKIRYIDSVGIEQTNGFTNVS